MNLLLKNRFFFTSLLFASPAAIASMGDAVIFPIYLAELFVIGLVSLALIFVFLLILKDRRRQNLKIEQFNEEMEQKKNIAQMLINSIHEKEKSVSYLSELANDESAEPSGDSATLALPADKLHLEHNVKEEPAIDPRKLAVDGSVKQAYFGKNSYVENMHSICEEGISTSIDTVDSMLQALLTAKNRVDGNLKSLNESYQSLSSTIESLELEGQHKKSSKSEETTLQSLQKIRDRFDELIERKQLYKELYDDFYLELKTVQNEGETFVADNVESIKKEVQR